MLLVVAAVSGLMDLDAITLSTKRLVGTTVDLATAIAAILIAVVVNLLTKVVLAFTAGGKGPYAIVLALATSLQSRQVRSPISSWVRPFRHLDASHSHGRETPRRMKLRRSRAEKSVGARLNIRPSRVVLFRGHQPVSALF